MTAPIIFGLSAAIGWGSADFVARFTSRALGHQVSLVGMLAASAAIFTALVWWSDTPLNTDPGGWWLLLGSGVGLTTATLLLYRCLTKGSVTVVVPIISSYPAFVLLIGVFLGVLPSLAQFGAMLTVMAGVAVVAVCAGLSSDSRTGGWAQVMSVVGVTLVASACFAVTLILAQQTIAFYGELQSIWMIRLIALATSVLLFAFKRRAPSAPMRWWPVLAVQGILDGGAYLAVLYGGAGVGGQITIVIASCFSAVAVILARIFLREVMTAWQWLGIATIISGVAWLSWL